MRNFDPDILTELAKEILYYYNTIEFQFTSTYRYTDRDVSVFVGANRYYPRHFTFNNISLSSTMGVDSVSVSMENIDRVFSGIILNEDVRNKTVILSFGVRRKPTDITGSVSLSNMKLSLADGIAFVDFSLASVLTDYLGSKLTITDSAGKKAIGYIKAVGTGETYSDELVTSNWDNATFTTWTPGIGSLITRAARAIPNGYCYHYEGSSLAGKLVKCINTVTFSVGDVAHWQIDMCQYPNINALSFDDNGTSYKTAQSNFNCLRVSASAAVDFSLTSFSAQYVLTPSATGVTIVSTPGGAIQNWESIETGFNYNDVNGYTYLIEQPEIDEVQPLFRGILAGWDIEGDNKINIEISNEFILWNKKTLRKHSPSCPWAFKGEECGYQGVAKSICDKSYDTCLELSNQSHFGGFRFIPIITEKELWWGSVRG